jgi:recombinational DNA repair protein RecT
MSKNQSAAIQLIDNNKSRLTSVGLRKDLSFSDWRNSALMLIENTDLRHCMDSKGGQISLMNALTFAAITRLSLLPTLGYACIIPRRSKSGEMHATYQLEKNGMVKLSSDAGYTVDSITLRENDDVVEFSQGQFSDRLVIKPALKKRGPVIGYFARAMDIKRKDSPLRVHYMTLDEVLDHAVKHASSYDVQDLLSRINRENNIDDELKGIMFNKNVSYNLRQASWIKSFHGMAEKTVVKALLGKPCFSNILNVAANAEVAQENAELDDANVITVEVENKGAANTKRELHNQRQNQSRKTTAKKPKQETQQQNDPPVQEDVPPPEESPFD